MNIPQNFTLLSPGPAQALPKNTVLGDGKPTTELLFSFSTSIEKSNKIILGAEAPLNGVINAPNKFLAGMETFPSGKTNATGQGLFKRRNLSIYEKRQYFSGLIVGAALPVTPKNHWWAYCNQSQIISE